MSKPSIVLCCSAVEKKFFLQDATVKKITLVFKAKGGISHLEDDEGNTYFEDDGKFADLEPDKKYMVILEEQSSEKIQVPQEASKYLHEFFSTMTIIW